MTREQVFLGIGMALWAGFLLADVVRRDRQRGRLRREIDRLNRDIWVLSRTGHLAEARAKLEALDRLTREAAIR